MTIYIVVKKEPYRTWEIITAFVHMSDAEHFRNTNGKICSNNEWLDIVECHLRDY